MKTSLANIAATAFVMAAMATSAEARRIVIDENEDGSGTELEVGGYCDLDGLDCDPMPLGYTVDFGQGALTQVIVYGNALLSFGPNPVPLSEVSSLADYGATVVSPGLNNELAFLADNSYSLVGRLSVDPLSGVITALFQDCFTPQFCFLPNSSLTLTPTSGGYQALATNPNPALSGFALSDGTVDEQVSGSRSFFIPASFSGLNLQSAVPEPGTWAMMLVGFGAVGFSMRRRRTRMRLSYASG